MASAGCLRGGAERVSDGVYVVHAKGNAFVSQSEAIAEAYRQASAACPSGFTVGDGANGTTSSFVRLGDSVQEFPTSGASR